MKFLIIRETVRRKGFDTINIQTEKLTDDLERERKRLLERFPDCEIFFTYVNL